MLSAAEPPPQQQPILALIPSLQQANQLASLAPSPATQSANLASQPHLLHAACGGSGSEGGACALHLHAVALLGVRGSTHFCRQAGQARHARQAGRNSVSRMRVAVGWQKQDGRRVGEDRPCLGSGGAPTSASKQAGRAGQDRRRLNR